MSNPNNLNNLSERAKFALFDKLNKMVDGLDTVEIADLAVTTAKLAALAVTTAKINTNAVTAAKLATTIDLVAVAFTSLAIENGTPVNAVAATQKLTLATIIVPGTHGETVLTTDTTEVDDGKIITIDGTVYRFKTTMALAFDVKRNGTAALTLDNLKAAINATGTDGVEYFAGTTAHPTVVATTNTDTTQKIVVRIPGTASNAEVTTTDAAHLSWADSTIGGGTSDSTAGIIVETATIDGRVYSFVDVLSETNAPAAAIAGQVLFGGSTAVGLDNFKLAINAGDTAGTNYSTGTAVHATVTATTNSNTEQTVAAKIKGTAAHSIALTEAMTQGSWGAAILANGVNGTVGIANEILSDGSYIYHALAVNTIVDANWRRVALGSVY